MNLTPQTIQPTSGYDPPRNRRFKPRTQFETGGFDSVFWLTYLANTSLMIAVSVLFRYSDFVNYAGGTAFHLGLIVGIGTVGALAMRVFQGVGIDRFGPRVIWLVSLVTFITSMLIHTQITSVQGVAVYFARILMMTSLAGAFGASITFISLRVPERRMAEMVGTLGSSGFVGIALGPFLGDLLFGGGSVTQVHIERMFYLASSMGIVSITCAAIATRGLIRTRASRRPSTISLVRRYHPGAMLAVAIGVGWAVGVPGTFLRPYAEGLGINHLRIFFITYAMMAFAVRISCRRLPEQIGVRPMIVIGFGCLSLSMLLYLVVNNEWLLTIPATFAGAGHALLFPSVTAGGSSTFPARYRGLATTLMLAMYDMGTLLGQPVIGCIVEFSARFGLAPYATMFVCMSGGLICFALIYALISRNQTNASEAATNRKAVRFTGQPAKVKDEVSADA